MKFNRWCVVFKHDKSPLDECLFIHKAKAEKKMNEMDNKNKLEVISMELKVDQIGWAY
jgi:hypothetical protein